MGSDSRKTFVPIFIIALSVVITTAPRVAVSQKSVIERKKLEVF